MNWQTIFVYGVVVFAIGLFFSNRVRLDITAALVMILLAVSGVLTASEAVSGFGNPLVMLIAGLFVVSEGLNRTGVAPWIGLKIASFAGNGETQLLLVLMPVVALLSAFMSSTGVVALFIPVILSMAREAGIAPSRLLLPVAIASLVGGMLTLIGTPPNLVVNRSLIDAGFSGFGFFDFSLVGGSILIMTLLFMVVVGRRLLPVQTARAATSQRKRLHEMASDFGIQGNLYRLRIQPGSSLIDKTVSEMGLRRDHGLTVIAMERKYKLLMSLQPVLKDTRLRANDTLIVSTGVEDLAVQLETLGLEDKGFPHGLQRRYHESFGVAEALVVPRSPLIGKSLLESNLRERQRVNVLSVRRGDGPLALDFRHTEIQMGDVLLITGAWSDIEKLIGPRRDLVLLELPDEAAQRTWHANQAPWAVAITLMMLVLMVFQLTSNLLAVMLAAFAMIVTRCVAVEESYRSMNWQTLVLIAGMLPLALALDKTGGSAQIVSGLTGLFRGHGPHVMMIGLFVLTSVFSQFISNTATTVLLSPIALSLALDLNYQPYPFMMAVAIAASTAFATPIASPVNTLIVAPGQYRFTDFLKIGIPLQLLALVITVLLVPWIFPFVG
jgi:di/tricarboxylate transporter